jgi:protein gp37
MAQDSKIEWTHHTANLWHGCAKVHEGCDNCYAEALAKRFGNDVWGADKPRKEIKSFFTDLAKYQKLAAQAGEVHRVFVGSMMDIFEKPMPLIDSKGEQYLRVNTGVKREEFLANISLGLYPNLMFLLLTKRPSNINKYIPESWLDNPPENVMFGTSISTQANADKLIPQLLQVKGKRFLSVEPQIESINIEKYLGGIDWVIQGGESGAGKRPFITGWAYYLKTQCENAGTPYFFKQIDKVQAIPDDLMVRQFPKEAKVDKLITFTYGAMSSKYSVQAANKLTAYVCMVAQYDRSAFAVVMYEPEEIVEDDQWCSFDGKIAARLDEIFGGENAFDLYCESHLEEIKACYKTIKQIV